MAGAGRTVYSVAVLLGQEREEVTLLARILAEKLQVANCYSYNCFSYCYSHCCYNCFFNCFSYCFSYCFYNFLPTAMLPKVSEFRI